MCFGAQACQEIVKMREERSGKAIKSETLDEDDIDDDVSDISDVTCKLVHVYLKHVDDQSQPNFIHSFNVFFVI